MISFEFELKYSDNIFHFFRSEKIKLFLQNVHIFIFLNSIFRMCYNMMLNTEREKNGKLIEI